MINAVNDCHQKVPVLAIAADDMSKHLLDHWTEGAILIHCNPQVLGIFLKQHVHSAYVDCGYIDLMTVMFCEVGKTFMFTWVSFRNFTRNMSPFDIEP